MRCALGHRRSEMDADDMVTETPPLMPLAVPLAPPEWDDIADSGCATGEAVGEVVEDGGVDCCGTTVDGPQTSQRSK